MVTPPPTTAIADVLALRGRRGWLSPPLQPFAGVDGAVAGKACTVTLQRGSGGFGELYGLLSGDLTGRMMVISAPSDEVAVWGELLGLAAARAGVGAVLVAGAIRDVVACGDVGVPLWAQKRCTVGPAGGLEVAAVGAGAAVGGTMVNEGDVVVVDADGVVAVPASAAPGVLVDAGIYADGEHLVETALRAGRPLHEAYRHKAAAVANLRAR